jgi:hypothetical protein
LFILEKGQFILWKRLFIFQKCFFKDKRALLKDKKSRFKDCRGPVSWAETGGRRIFGGQKGSAEKYFFI